MAAVAANLYYMYFYNFRQKYDKQHQVIFSFCSLYVIAKSLAFNPLCIQLRNKFPYT